MIRTVIFLSNYFNHHQKSISDAFFSRLGEGYLFIETAQMPQERKRLGWEMKSRPSYVITAGEFLDHLAHYQQRIRQADVVIYGDAPPSLVRQRIRNRKLTFRYSERPLKKGFQLWKYPIRFVLWHMRYPDVKNHCLLCAGAYGAEDYAKFRMFRHRCYVWGYFPETYHYQDPDALIQAKTHNSIVWAARFLQCKHPELVVEAGKRLQQEGYGFEIRMIGDGPLWESVRDLVRQGGLEKSIHLPGAMPPEAVRAHMEKAEIHLFTSDREEGWGAVLNEAMNSGCVPVADVRIGSVPYLLEEGKNGFTYSTAEELYEKLKYLLDHRDQRLMMAREAYSTIVTEWNGENAVNRFLKLCSHLLQGHVASVPAQTGVCSRAR